MYQFLLILFIIHFCVALRLYLKKKRFEYGLLMIVFALLTGSVVLRIYMPDAGLFDISYVNILRVSASSLSFISISLMILNFVKRGR